MQYTQEVLFIEKLISNVLLSLNKNSLFQNEDFKVYQKLHFEHWVRVSLCKPNAIIIIFEISNSGLRIDVDRTEELVGNFSYEYIYNNYEKIEELLLMIFTSTIMVQYCGDYLTNLYFIKNKTVQTYRYSTKLGLLRFLKKCEEKIYLPIYDK